MPDTILTEKRLIKVEKDLETIKSHFATKADLLGFKSDLHQELSSVKSDLQQEIASVKSDLQQELSSTGVNLQREIATTKIDLIRWMITLSFASPTLLVTLLGLAKHFGLIG